MFIKTSSPDWVTDLYSCDCELFMCPICDSDFYVDMAREDSMVFLPEEDLEPPF